MNKMIKAAAVAAVSLTMAFGFAACAPSETKLGVDSDGYLTVNGEKTDIFVNKDGEDGEDGVNGKSAYELYVEANPFYKGDESKWLADLTSGKLADRHYNLISYGRNIAGTAVKGTIATSEAEMTLTGAVVALNQPVILPLEENSSWDISFGGILMPGGSGGGQILTSCAETADGRIYVGINSGNNVLFMGVCIEGFYANYCWDVTASTFSEKHDYVISYKDGKYLLSIDGAEAKGMTKLNINQGNITAVTPEQASDELTAKIRAVTGQNYAVMTHIGANSHLCTNKFSYYEVNTSALYGYENLSAHPLNGKTIYYLGSSVTRGHGGDTDGTAFGDITHKLTGNPYQKEAISGTTLALKSSGDNSYVSRLDNFDFTKKPDVLVVQLSTNDFSQNINLGAVSAPTSVNSGDFDKSTMTGAIEYIVAKVKELSPDTKVVLYTCPLGSGYGSKTQYEGYVNGPLKKLVSKWSDTLSVLDLYSGGYIKVPSYMQGDDLHPTKSGYAHVFTPSFINLLAEIL